MLKETICYTDYNGETHTEDFYFNFNKAELTEMKRAPLHELQDMLERIKNMDDPGKELSYQEVDELVGRIMGIVNTLIIDSYGVKSEDGKRFVKKTKDGHKLGEEFVETDAYSELYGKLSGDINNVVAFVRGIIPPDVQGNFDKAIDEAKSDLVGFDGAENALENIKKG